MLPPIQLARLEGFHVECASQLQGMKPRKRSDKWVYPKLAAVLAKAGLEPLGYYIQKRRVAVATAIEGRSVLKECRRVRRLHGAPICQTWWEQCLDPPEEEDQERVTAVAAARRTWRLPVPLVPQVPHGPMPEEDTKADCRLWRAAHVQDCTFTAPVPPRTPRWPPRKRRRCRKPAKGSYARRWQQEGGNHHHQHHPIRPLRCRHPPLIQQGTPHRGWGW